MKPNERLFEAIGNLDDDLLDTLEEGRRHPLGWTALAACLALLMLCLWSGPSVQAPRETWALQTLGTEGVQVVILERRDYAVLIPQEESVAVTDYVAQVRDSYSGGLAEGETITIRTLRGTMEVQQGDILLTALEQVEDSPIYVPALGTAGTYTVNGNEAIPINGGEPRKLEAVIAVLCGD